MPGCLRAKAHNRHEPAMRTLITKTIQIFTLGAVAL